MIDILIELAIEAGMTIRKIYESGKFTTTIKSDRTPVTTADEEANKMIASALRCSVPLLSSGANKVNTRSTGCLSADSKSIGRSKLKKNPNIFVKPLYFLTSLIFLLSQFFLSNYI